MSKINPLLLNYARELHFQFTASGFILNTLVCFNADKGDTYIFYYNKIEDKVIRLM